MKKKRIEKWKRKEKKRKMKKKRRNNEEKKKKEIIPGNGNISCSLKQFGIWKQIPYEGRALGTVFSGKHNSDLQKNKWDK